MGEKKKHLRHARKRSTTWVLGLQLLCECHSDGSARGPDATFAAGALWRGEWLNLMEDFIVASLGAEVGPPCWSSAGPRCTSHVWEESSQDTQRASHKNDTFHRPTGIGCVMLSSLANPTSTCVTRGHGRGQAGYVRDLWPRRAQGRGGQTLSHSATSQIFALLLRVCQGRFFLCIATEGGAFVRTS